MQRLSSSYRLVDEQLRSFRHKRLPGTLRWVIELREFQNWRIVSLDDAVSSDRILWFRGISGIGKSHLAAYIVGLLMRRSPDSIVLYFFFRSHQDRLTKISDMIRTLACQCDRSDIDARGVLRSVYGEALENEHDIKLLFKKLLFEPLDASQKEVFIITDGLDEIDPSDHSNVQELLRNLITLPSARLLFLSKPNIVISDIIPNLTIKTISLKETGQDVDAYVNRIVGESARLTMFFRSANVNPIQYSRDNGNGVLLWVILVLRILANSKNSLIFRQRLLTFSDTSGSVDALYKSLFSGIEPEYVPWVQESIRWVALAETRFRVSDLQKAVEWSMQGTLADFRGFLESQCGMIFEFSMRHNMSDPLVHLIDETFRSFVLYSDQCPPKFRIDAGSSHSQLALHCIRALANGGRPVSSSYGLLEWATHLSKATAFNQSAELFLNLRKFFNSEGGMLWIRRCIISNISLSMLSANPHEIEVELPHLQPIISWMSLSQPSLKEYITSIAYDSDTRTLNSNNAAESTTIIYEYFGKAIIRLWFGGDLSCFEAQACFLLALKYYWQRTSRNGSNLNDIDELAATEFNGMLEWSKYEGSVKRMNLGVGYYVLQKWDDCIRLLGVEDNSSKDVQEYLGLACMANGDYDNAIKHFKEIIHTRPNSPFWLRPGLLDAYLAKGNYRDAILEFENAIKHVPLNPLLRTVLGYLYIANQDYDAAIQTFNKVPHGEWPLLGLYMSYMSKRDYKGGLKRLENFQGTVWRYNCLAELYYARGDYDNAIKLFSPPGSSKNLPYFVSARVLTYAEKRDWDAAIAEFEKAAEEKVRLSTISVMAAVLESYKGQRMVARAVDVFRNAIANLSNDDRIRGYWLWGLIEAYKANGDFDSAIETFNTIEGDTTSSILPPTSLIISALEIYELKDDFPGSIGVLEIAARKMTSKQGSLLSQCVFDFCIAAKQYDYATQLFEKTLKAYPLCSWLWSRLAESYKAKGDHDNAINMHKSAIQHFSVNYLFHKQLGDLYMYNSRREEAIEEYNATIQLSRAPAILYAYLRIDLVQPSEFRPTTAITIDETLVPRYFLWYSLAEAYKGISDVENANKVCDAVIEAYQIVLQNATRNDFFWQFNEPGMEWGLFDVFYRKSSLPDPVLWAAMGTAYLCKGEMIEAAQAYRMALEKDQSNRWLRNTVRELEESNGMSTSDFNDVSTEVNSASQPLETERTILSLRETTNRKVLCAKVLMT